ncbi:endo-1,4-beta-xylanase [Lachnoclostridium phytofermentans]|uniref:Beta-xylanase n=1 Tax=Lachnoclostridium phytofermentans (strain ATCC 700394 / DSM 18823 / ISDg) TaxID=357809 RepID=A9KQ55_LACP7|nr:endo-1,4-beta-xylanase [Lachnoclostridium phytofermentans]ABX43367.1 Endo-1,4-beta-xylanase [Lachnoclostridium phytofermentans ISDg]
METLKEKYKDYFLIGAAVNASTIRTHGELIKDHFNSITCENEMKFSNLCPREKEYQFEKADTIVQFAKDNELKMRMHTLVWHNQTPEWVFLDTTKEGLEERLSNHIHMLGKRYGKDCYSVDVVNEAIEDKLDGFLRESSWLQGLGNDYIERAFLLAKQEMPEAKLFYNDYNETNPIKRDKIFKLIKELKEKGIPVDGIGMQCHINIYHSSMDELKEAIEKYLSLGVSIEITEMDVSMFRHEDRSEILKPTIEQYKAQARVYKECFQIFREYKNDITSVTLWGVSDDVSWLNHFPVNNRRNWPLLFDEMMKPKEAFYEIMNF